jgi:hypothetical protein
MNGKQKNNYEVVFPYSNRVSNYYNEYKRREPEYDCTRECSNSIVVKNIYDTYEDANEEAQKLNQEILNKTFSYLSIEKFLEKQEEITDKHNDKIGIYKLLETEIEKNTEDLKVDGTNKEQTIIVVKNGKAKLINESLYQYIKFISDYSFTAFNVTEEEYNKLKQQVKNKETLDKKYLNCLMVNKDLKIKLINYNDNNSINFNLINDRMYYLPDKNNNFIINENIVIYTMEKYEDIIDSYFKYDPIDIDKIAKEKTKVKR